MAIVQTACTVFKTNLLKGDEDFNTGTPYVYKIALYSADANLDANTLVYTSANEVSGSGYTAGGAVLVPIAPTSDGTVSFISFNPAVWLNVSFTARGALIYNATTGAAVAILNFGSDKTAGPNFTVVFPTANATNAIIRIS